MKSSWTRMGTMPLLDDESQLVEDVDDHLERTTCEKQAGAHECVEEKEDEKDAPVVDILTENGEAKPHPQSELDPDQPSEDKEEGACLLQSVDMGRNRLISS